MTPLFRVRKGVFKISLPGLRTFASARASLKRMGLGLQVKASAQCLVLQVIGNTWLPVNMNWSSGLDKQLTPP